MPTHHIPILSRFLHRMKFLFLFAILSFFSVPVHAETLTSPFVVTTNASSSPTFYSNALTKDLEDVVTDHETLIASLRKKVEELTAILQTLQTLISGFPEDSRIPGINPSRLSAGAYAYELTPSREPLLSNVPSVGNNVGIATEVFTPPLVKSIPAQEIIPALGANHLSLPYQSSLYLNEWRGDWGSATTSPDGVLLLRATASTTGATALLPGSSEWTDYSYTADVTLNVNGSFSLLGRYADAKNFLSCTFAGRYVSINETLNGVRKQVASVRLPTSISSAVLSNTNVRMEVSKNRITCSRTGAADVSYTISDDRLMKGGIGISNWFSTPGVSTLDLRSVKVVGI